MLASLLAAPVALFLSVVTPVVDFVDDNITITKNAESGLTDFDIFGKEFSLLVEEKYEVNE